MNNTENTKAYYDMLIDAGNDPVRDSPLTKQYNGPPGRRRV